MLTLLLLLASVPEAPAEIHRILPAGQGYFAAWVTPISPVHLLTAAHVVENVETINVLLEPRRSGVARVLWRHQSRDIALLILDGTTAAGVIRFCGRDAIPGERIWYGIMLSTGEPAYTYARVIDVDQNGRINAFGFTHPGTSGSSLLADSGCLLGVSFAGANWSAERPNRERILAGIKRGDYGPLLDALEQLERKDAFTPAHFGEALHGWPSKDTP